MIRKLVHCTKNPQGTADLVTFTGEILNGKLHFLYSGNRVLIHKKSKNLIKSDWLVSLLPMLKMHESLI